MGNQSVDQLRPSNSPKHRSDQPGPKTDSASPPRPVSRRRVYCEQYGDIRGQCTDCVPNGQPLRQRDDSDQQQTQRRPASAYGEWQQQKPREQEMFGRRVNTQCEDGRDYEQRGGDDEVDGRAMGAGPGLDPVPDHLVSIGIPYLVEVSGTYLLFSCRLPCGGRRW
ncbi:hypothetical protein GCM10009534_14780 [Kribbella sandramycini]